MAELTHAWRELIQDTIEIFRSELLKLHEDDRWGYVAGIKDRGQQICAEIALHQIEARAFLYQHG